MQMKKKGEKERILLSKITSLNNFINRTINVTPSSNEDNNLNLLMMLGG